jgi:hypothetical protein
MIFKLMTQLIRGQEQQTGQRPEMKDYKKAAEFLARQDVAGKLATTTEDEIMAAYLASLTAK